MIPGTIFRWIAFPYPKYGGEIKPRWFIYLGDTGPFLTPIIVHICTTTTSLSEYRKGGDRESHPYIRFNNPKYPFEQECILDLDEAPYQTELSELKDNPNIEIRGELSHDDLKNIYKRIQMSDHYSMKIRCDIHASLNRIGVGGLSRP